MKLLIDKGIIPHKNNFILCIDYGYEDILEYLYDKSTVVFNPQEKTYHFRKAGVCGHLNILKFLENRGMHMTERVLKDIIKEWSVDHVDILDYYEKKGIVFTPGLLYTLDEKKLPKTYTWLSKRILY